MNKNFCLSRGIPITGEEGKDYRGDYCAHCTQTITCQPCPPGRMNKPQ